MSRQPTKTTEGKTKSGLKEFKMKKVEKHIGDIGPLGGGKKRGKESSKGNRERNGKFCPNGHVLVSETNTSQKYGGGCPVVCGQVKKRREKGKKWRNNKRKGKSLREITDAASP